MFLFAPIRLALKLVSAAIVAALAYTIFCAVQVVRASQPAPVPSGSNHFATILVIGTPLQTGALTPDLTARLETAASLFSSHDAPRILVTGPSSSGTSATDLERSWLVQHGVAPSAITALPAANAAQSIAASVQSLGTGARVVIVTDAIDTLWTQSAASHAGLQPRIAAAQGSERLFVFEILPMLREASAIAVGRVIGYEHTSWAGPATAHQDSTAVLLASSGTHSGVV